MHPLARRSTPPGTDPRLHPFLDAATDADADRALAGLMDEAAPVFGALVQRKMRGANRTDAEDVASEARTQLAIHLLRLRATPDDRPPIADFHAYAATVAFSAWAGNLRQRQPGRAALLNRLRYLLEGRVSRHGLARWTGPGGEPLAGFAVWQDTPAAPMPARHQLLRADPRAAAESFGGGGAGRPLAEQVAALLTWLGGPLPLRELTDALAEAGGVLARPEPLPSELYAADGAVGSAGAFPVDPRPSPHDALRWKEYLLWLRDAAARLTRPQRTAFLFHSPCLREMEILGLTSVRQAAALLELPPVRVAEYWNALPLEDRAIAGLLGVESQKVVNLRKVARVSLFRAWRKWLDEK